MVGTRTLLLGDLLVGSPLTKDPLWEEIQRHVKHGAAVPIEIELVNHAARLEADGRHDELAALGKLLEFMSNQKDRVLADVNLKVINGEPCPTFTFSRWRLIAFTAESFQKAVEEVEAAIALRQEVPKGLLFIAAKIKNGQPFVVARYGTRKNQRVWGNTFTMVLALWRQRHIS